MLGYVTGQASGSLDRLIREVAQQLRAQGIPLAGAVQINVERGEGAKCHMDLHVLIGTEVVRIGRNRGQLSGGCRLGPAGLERAVGLAGAGLGQGARMLVVNKFGKQEAEGRGFRQLIAEALARGIPVLTGVNAGNLAAFLHWAEDLAQPLPCDAAGVLGWCQAQIAEASAA